MSGDSSTGTLDPRPRTRDACRHEGREHLRPPLSFRAATRCCRGTPHLREGIWRCGGRASGRTLHKARRDQQTTNSLRGAHAMKAEIISVGTEILLGEIQDTNSQFISSRLPAIGLDLYFISTVGDNLQRLTEALERALARSDVVLMTGGLGPTEDDLTREAIAAALGEELFVDADAERQLRAFFQSRGVGFPERNVKQAMLIPSSTAIPNPRGTAPGWWVEKTQPDIGDRYIVAMPGP